MVSYSAFGFTGKPEQKSKMQIYQVSKHAKGVDVFDKRIIKHKLSDLKSHQSMRVDRDQRDRFIASHVEERSHKWDELDKDMFILRLKHYSEKDFKRKYKNIYTPSKYKKMRKDFENSF